MKQTRIRAVLVDDERHALGNLNQLLHSYCRDIEVIGMANTVFEALKQINSLQPDVLFLDIQMPGQSGFDLIEQLHAPPLIVFVTAFDSYAIRALKFAAIDYLLKPIDITELMQVEQKLKEMLSLSKMYRDNYPLMLKNFSSLLQKKRPTDKITIPSATGYELVPLDQIMYLHADNNYSRFHLIGNRQIIVAKTLKDYEDILIPSGFKRIHKSILVNMQFARSIQRKEQHVLLLANGESLTISRRKLPELLEVLKIQ